MIVVVVVVITITIIINGYDGYDGRRSPLRRFNVKGVCNLVADILHQRPE